jgi:hypothetical protein
MILFEEDDQAPLIELLAKSYPEFFKEKDDGKIHESYRFVIIDFGVDKDGKI